MSTIPKVSVVIPVYNVAPYLRECLDSVVNQTLREIEIICVNDGSTDACPQILKEYAAKDDRITVIHKPNGGYGQTMNMGIAAASGEYISIVDSDDWILPGMCETLYGQATKHDLDFAKADFFWYWGTLHDRKRMHYDYFVPYYGRVLENEDMVRFWNLWVSSWTGIYKREFLVENHIRHNETPGASYQDNGFWVQIMAMSKRGMWIDDAFYMYRQDNPASSVKSREKMLAMMGEFDFAASILQEKGLHAELEICNVYRIRGHYGTFYRISDSLKKEYARIICEDYAKHKAHINWDAYSNSKMLRQWIQEIREDPEGAADREIAVLDRCRRKLDASEGLILYGTGRRAEAVFAKLFALSYADKILFAAETDPADKSSFFSLEVKRAAEIEGYQDRALVLLAVSKANNSKAYAQMEDNLKRMGITNYLDTKYIDRLG